MQEVLKLLTAYFCTQVILMTSIPEFELKSFILVAVHVFLLKLLFFN